MNETVHKKRIIGTYNKNNCLIGIHSKNLFSEYNPIKWKGNRPSDETRYPEIKETIERNRKVDGIIYLAKLDGKWVCYDGNHRLECLRSLSYEDKSFYILVDLLENCTEKDVINKFKILNQSIPVPEIHFYDDENEEELNRKKTVEYIVKYFFA